MAFEAGERPSDRQSLFAKQQEWIDYNEANGITATGNTPPQGYTQAQWDAMNALERRDAVADPWYSNSESRSHSSMAGRTDEEVASATSPDSKGSQGLAQYINEYHYKYGEYPDFGRGQGNVGAAPQYGQAADPMAMNDARRGGNIEGMDYSRSAPPPMVRPQGRNTMLPQYGTDPYMPVGQGAPSAGAMQTYTPRTTSAPMPPRQKEPPRRPTSTPNTPHQYPSTPWLGPPQRPGYTAPTLNAPQQVAPGTPGAASVSLPSAPPSQLGDPAAIAQQQALATMALGGSAPAPGLGGTTTIKPPTFRF